MTRKWLITCTVALTCGSLSLHPASSQTPHYNLKISQHKAAQETNTYELTENRGAMSDRIKTESDLIPLNREQILSNIVGRKIEPYLTGEQITLDFFEEFFPDGRWIGVRKMRGPVEIKGTWFLDDNKICVKISDGTVKCRNVWTSPSSGQFYIADIYPGTYSDKVIHVKIY